MNFLFKYNLTIKLFTDFLMKGKYPAKEILLGDFKSNLGTLLEFLSSQGIYCLVDCYNVLVYTDGITPRTRYYIEKHNKVYIINETDNEEKRDIIHNYMLAIDKSFNFLNTPF